RTLARGRMGLTLATRRAGVRADNRRFIFARTARRRLPPRVRDRATGMTAWCTCHGRQICGVRERWMCGGARGEFGDGGSTRIQQEGINGCVNNETGWEHEAAEAPAERVFAD